jgi:ribonucleoside-diphosphate reductase beta chain
MPNILDAREALRPFEYPQLEDRAKAISNTHWVHDEIDFSKDKHEYLTELSTIEKYVIGTILKTFAQTEVHVADEFWSQLYQYMPKPEVSLICSTFTENEWRHALAYDRLNTELGLTDYATFLQDEVATKRLENLLKIKRDHGGKPNTGDLMVTLAVFGGFTEYVNLFSQFAILRSFSSNGRNLLTNIGEIIDWSALDEQHHSKTALELFSILKEENPQEWTEALQNRIYTAAILTYDIEKKLIDQIFKYGDLPNLTKSQLMNFMSYRINDSLSQMGLKAIKNVDEAELKQLQWFEDGLNANSHADFFAKRNTDYTKNLVAFTSQTVKVDKDYIKSLTKLDGQA